MTPSPTLGGDPKWNQNENENEIVVVVIMDE